MDWYRLFHPSFWIQNDPTDIDWDRELNKALDENLPTKCGRYTCKVGSLEVWISNWPYGYGTPYSDKLGTVGVMPTARTRLRLRKAVTLGTIQAMKGGPNG